MRSRNMDARNRAMEPESGEQDYEPLSKRSRLNLDGQEASSSSKLSNESLDTGCADSGSSPENNQGNEVDHRSDDSIYDVDNNSNSSNNSGLDGHCDETSWQPVAGPISWVQRQMSMGVKPQDVLREYVGDDLEIPAEWDDLKLWKIIISMMVEPKPRDKLPHINTLQDVINLLKNCQNIMVLTGAGVSVSCGIPDFRSRDGIYARLAKDFPNLPDPQAMFCLDFFREDQRPFFKFAKEIYPGQFKPSPCHKFIKLLENRGKLLRNYTQNIDTLEKVAGIERVIECHGSFATATCMVCKYKVDAEAIRNDIFNQQIPRCPHCDPDVKLAVMKPDIVFFGESLPEEFHKQMAADKDVCDLLIVIGSSLKVRPVALIPNSLPAHVPQIIINREPLHRQLVFDVELLGNCDDIISELCKRLGAGWDHLAQTGPPAEEICYSSIPLVPVVPPVDLPEVDVKGRQEVLEHSADSGLGDSEVVSSAAASGKGDRNQESSFGSSLAFSKDQQCVSGSERLERLSSDSGAESSTTPDIQGHICLSVAPPSSDHTPAAVPSEHRSGGDGVSSSVPDSQESVVGKDSSSVEVSTQGDCTSCNTSQEVCEASEHTGHSAKRPQSPEASKRCRESTHHTSASHNARHRRASEGCCNPEVHSNGDGQSPHKHQSSVSHSQGNEDGEKIDLDRESKKDNAHCSHTDTIEEMRQTWALRRRLSVASKMAENQIIFVPPNRYIFRGAEVYSDDSDASNSDSEDSSAPFSLMFDNESADPEDTNDAVNSSSPSSSPIRAVDGLNSSADLSDAVTDKGCLLSKKELKEQGSESLH